MAVRVTIGATSSGDIVSLDVARLVDTRMLVQANSGGGKSWALRRILEQTHGKLQHLVIDPEGEFASLREKYDYVLAARSGGDTTADPRAAKLLAERLLELGVSAILDIYDLKAHERVKFVRYFLEALVDAPKSLWHPALVVVDEAHVYCPEKGEAESAGAVIDLCTRGRKRGFCPLLATQRLAKLHKDAAAELNNKLIGRTGLDVDLKRACDELGFGKERWPELRATPPGTFFAFGPALSVTGVSLVLIGDVQTTHPKAGHRLATTAPPPTEKVKALLPKLADLPAEAEQRQRTAEDLRKEVASLKAQLRARPSERVEKEKVVTKTIEKPVLTDAQIKRMETVAARLVAEAKRHGKAMADFWANQDEVNAALLAALRSVSQGPPPLAVRPAPRLVPAVARVPVQARHPSTPSPANGHGDLTGPEQRILDALAWLESIGQKEAEQSAVAFLARYTVGGGAFNNPRGKLNTKGLILYCRDDRLALTEAGRGLAHFPEEELTAAELQRRVLERLPGPERRILDVLLRAYPESVGNDDLARAANYEPGGGAFNNPRGRLRTLGLIDYERGQVRALPVLFLEGAS
jgi:hypothetical protein